MSEERNDEVEEFEIDLDSMDDDELVAFEAALQERYLEIRQSEDFGPQDKPALTEIKDVLAEVRELITFRAETLEDDDVVAQSAGDSLKAAKAAQLAKAELAAEPDEEEEEVEEVEEEKEEVELSAEAKDEVVISPTGLEGDTKPSDVKKAFNIVAAGDIRGFRSGEELADWSGIARAFVAKRPDVRGSDRGADGNRFLVASVRGDYPEDRTLDNDLDSNMEKINAVTSHQAIIASGGYCAPLPARYELTVYGDAHRPVRDALPVFRAERGGIRFMPAPQLADLSGSTRHTTAAQDAAGYTNQDPAGSTAPKPCLHVTCESEQSSVIEAIHRCLTFGNLGARTYPEQVEAWLKLGLAEFSRYAETRLLDAISAASTQLDATQTYGATFSLLEQISLVLVSFRARHRLSSNAKFRALFPFWVTEIIKNDIAAQGPGDGLSRFGITDDQVRGWFAARGVNVTFYQDHTTADGAPFDAPVDGGDLWTWPGTVTWFLYPEGSFLYLDGGNLDLGLVRDSTLNSTNDYQIFYEEFAKVTFVGQESYEVTSTLCANGSYAPAADDLRTCPTS